MKPFKTISDQVEILSNRGIEIDVDDAERILLKENYYAIINGYKDPFLDRDRMQSTNEDVYVEGTKFSDIHQLFRFDRRLRSVTLEYLLMAENALKTATVYAFCYGHRGAEDYLDEESFSNEGDFLVSKKFKGDKEAEYRKRMERLLRILKKRVQTSRRPFIKHYRDEQGSVPLWVLSNDLTFGNISSFYQLMRRRDQNMACRCIDEISGRGVAGRTKPHDILRIYQVLVKYRNICAHGERLYCAEEEGVRYAELSEYLEKVLGKKTADEFRDKVAVLCDEYEALSGWMPDGNLKRAMGIGR